MEAPPRSGRGRRGRDFVGAGIATFGLRHHRRQARGRQGEPHGGRLGEVRGGTGLAAPPRIVVARPRSRALRLPRQSSRRPMRFDQPGAAQRQHVVHRRVLAGRPRVYNSAGPKARHRPTDKILSPREGTVVWRRRPPSVSMAKPNVCGAQCQMTRSGHSPPAPLSRSGLNCLQTVVWASWSSSSRYEVVLGIASAPQPDEFYWFCVKWSRRTIAMDSNVRSGVDSASSLLRCGRRNWGDSGSWQAMR